MQSDQIDSSLAPRIFRCVNRLATRQQGPTVAGTARKSGSRLWVEGTGSRTKTSKSAKTQIDPTTTGTHIGPG